jgi:Xaa-Pro aminopeptidase
MISDPSQNAPTDLFERRRRAVFERLGGSAMVLPAAPVQYASRDTERTYWPDRELYYLTGVEEPEAVAVLVGGPDPSFVLFVREREAEAELWAGPRLGPEEAGRRYGADEVYPLAGLEEQLPALLAGAERVHYRIGRGGNVERLVAGALERARARGPRTGTGPRGLLDPGEVLDDLRMMKDEHEISVIRRACAVTVDGHRRGAATIAPGVGEWVVEAAVEGAFRAAGARRAGFPTIAGSGPNACVLHYVENERVIGDADLVLVDAGAEFGLYHGDVTRTYPASGSFTARQRDVYDVVEAALHAGVEAALPGATILAVHDAATLVLVQGLVDLGALEGQVEDLIEEGAHKAFFPHQTSHWLGLDVHDPGDYARGGAPRRLEAGMVFTVEPGLYFRAADGASNDFDGIGIRVEDDVVITESGCEVLTNALPTAAGDVEALVGGLE